METTHQPIHQMIPYEILIRGDKDGKLSGSHCIDTPGADARPITAADLADIAPAINAAAIAETKELEAKHAEAIAAKDVELAAITTALSSLVAYKDTMILKVSAVIQSGDPAQFAALAEEFLTPEQEKERQAKVAKINELKAQAAALESELETA